MRTVVGFAVAILVVAALAPLAIEGRITAYPLVFYVISAFVVAACALATAVPLYAWLRWRGMATPWWIVLAGACSAWASFVALRVLSKPSDSTVGQVVLVQGGRFTAEGWLNLLQQSALMAVAGALGALVFLAIVRPWPGARRR